MNTRVSSGLKCQTQQAPVSRALELERLETLSRSVAFSGRRSKGMALFFLPGATGRPVPVRSLTFRRWIGEQYEQEHEAKVSRDSLDSFVRRFSLASRFEGATVQKAA